MLGDAGRVAISLLVCISALGAIHGQIFTGARIYYALGQDQPLLAVFGRWNSRLGTPVVALVAQMIMSLIPTLALGRDEDGPQRLIVFTTPVFWGFFFLVGVGLFVLRAREPRRPRPYRVWGYPATPIAFCLSSLFMIVATVMYAVRNQSIEALWALGVLAAGIVVAPLAKANRASAPDDA